MNILIRKNIGIDKDSITKCLFNLGNYLMQIDSLNRIHEMPNEAIPYTEEMFQRVSSNEGIIYVAEADGKVVGFIAGIIEEYEDGDSSGYGPNREGRIIELYVDEKFRGKKIGKLLIIKLEDYFKEKKCDLSRVDVFKTNKNAYEFYCKLSYDERNVELVKKIVG